MSPRPGTDVHWLVQNGDLVQIGWNRLEGSNTTSLEISTRPRTRQYLSLQTRAASVGRSNQQRMNTLCPGTRDQFLCTERDSKQAE